MPYARISDTFAFDSRLIILGDSAFAVVARATSYCGAQLTDGFIPEAIARTFDPGLKVFASLVGAEVLTKAPGGFQFPDWIREQRTKKEVEDDRSRQREKALKAAASVDRTDGGRFTARRPVEEPPPSSTPIRSNPNPIRSEENQELRSAKPPRECPATRALNECANASGGRLDPIERVSKGHAIKFNKDLKPLSMNFKLIGEWLAFGGEAWLGKLTYAKVLTHAIEWHEAAKGWNRIGRPQINKSTGFQPAAQSLDPVHRTKAMDFLINGAAKNGH